jgi:hypothetical protein
LIGRRQAYAKLAGLPYVFLGGFAVPYAYRDEARTVGHLMGPLGGHYVISAVAATGYQSHVCHEFRRLCISPWKVHKINSFFIIRIFF